MRLGHASIVDHSVDLTLPHFFYVSAKEQIPAPHDSKLHIPQTNLLLLAATQEPYKKVYLLMKKNIEEFSGKIVRRMVQQAEERKDRKSNRTV